MKQKGICGTTWLMMLKPGQDPFMMPSCHPDQHFSEKHDSLPEVVRSLRQNSAYPHPNSQIPVAPETFSYLGSASWPPAGGIALLPLSEHDIIMEGRQGMGWLSSTSSQ
jgi:hypothetical protein